MRQINRIIIHCSATKPAHDIGIAEIGAWHTARGFDGIGYHFVIKRNGLIQFGRPVAEIGAHTKGFNEDSIGICIVGGLDYDGEPSGFYYADEQWKSLRQLVMMCKAEHKKATVHGHNEFNVSKACPSFSVQEWLVNENI